MLDVIIVGAGGFGREVYHWAKQTFPASEYRITGFFSKNRGELENWTGGVGIVGDEDESEIREDQRFILAIGVMGIRKRVVQKLKQRGAHLLTLIHPTAVVANTARLGEGVVLCPFVTVSDNVVIGDFVMMNLYASCGHDARVGDYTVMAPYSILTGYAVAEEEVFLGSHVTVAPGKTVGKQSQVSANSLVLRNVPPGSLAHGVPAKAQPLP